MKTTEWTGRISGCRTEPLTEASYIGRLDAETYIGKTATDQGAIHQSDGTNDLVLMVGNLPNARLKVAFQNALG